MSTDASNILNAFDSLLPSDQMIVAAEILRRSVGDKELQADTFEELAAEVFHTYDAEEDDNAKS